MRQNQLNAVAMKSFSRKLHKIFSVISGLSLIFNSILPASVLPLLVAAPTYAQEETPTPTDAPMTEPTITVAPTPTEEPTVTPTLEITETPTETPTPTEEATPTPTITQEAIPTPTTTEPPHETSPPAEQGQILDGVSTIAPTPTAEITVSQPQTETVSEHGTLQAMILSNTNAQTLDINFDSTQPSGSATLTTDKADYAPTDTAVIAGTGFTAGETYTLIINSQDPPAITHEAQVTANANGDFIYSYQLDGTYRPNYSVTVKSGDTIVATTTFTDSPASGCTTDSGGPNDVAGQKDLNKMCVDYAGFPNSELITWNWDDTGWTGSNTGDACALFDTNSNGNADYAVCVQVDNTPAAFKAQLIYSCNDSSATNCLGNVLITPTTSTCSSSIQATDPFPGPANKDTGDNWPNDTVASCTVNLSDVGGTGKATLTDVCSYPSASTPSNASDCILFKSNAGKLTITKVLSPSDDPGLFNLQIDGVTAANGANVTNGGTTLTAEVDAGSHTVGETGGTSTLLSNYTSSVICKDAHGTGSVVTTTGTNPWTLTVADGVDILCTITNTRINNGSITIVKDAVPNDAQDFAFTTTGSGLSSFNLDDDADATLSNTQVFSDLAAGTYSVSEDVISGWTQTSAICSDGSPVSAIALAAGVNVTCTFTNTKQATLTINKVCSPTNDSGKFNLRIDGTTQKSDAACGESTGAVVVTAASHTVSETGGTGTNLSDYTSVIDGDCSSDGTISLTAGQNKTCTITNTRKPRLTVTKVVVNDNGGTKVISDFPLFVDGNSVTSGTTNTFSIGGHTVTETGDTGYSASFSDDCDSSGNVSLAAGDNKICTITNDDKTPALHLRKTITNDNGGTATVANFTLTADGTGSNDMSGMSPVDSGSGLKADTFALSETGPDGYSASAWNCVGGTQDGSNITLGLGESATCTITNDDQAAHLVVIKHVINDNGGTATADDFTLDAGGTSDSPDDFQGAESPGTDITLDAGAYNVTEIGPGGYSDTYSADCTGTIANGQTKTCTVTNDDVQPQLIVVKHVVNDNGGTADVGDFTMSVTGSSPTPNSFAGEDSPGTSVALNAGSYSVGETGPAGYSPVYSADCTGTIAIDEVKTCTVTNDDQPATLRVVKVVINDDGGSAVASDFTINVSGTNVSDTSFPGNSGGTSVTLDAGSYSVTEDPAFGYSTSYSTDCTGSVAVGDSKTCTVTNNDIGPRLTVIKHVINDNGGTAIAGNFSMLVTGTNANPAIFGGDETGTTVDLDAGSYSVGEIGPSGYAASFSADCTGSIAVGQTKTCTVTNDDQQAYITVVKAVTNDNGGTANSDDFDLTLEGNPVLSGVAVPVNPGTYTADETLLSGYSFEGFSGDCDTNGDTTVALGESKTCTLTNNDQQANITVVKVVTNDNGGSASPDDFDLTLEGNPVLSGVIVPVNPGTYTAGEITVPGYTFEGFSGDCDTNGDTTVALGESKTCTLTNNDLQAYLVVDKTVVNDNGGLAQPNDFLLTIDGNPVSDEVPYAVNPGNHTAGETPQPGYSAGIWGGDCNENAGVAVALGQTKTCTVTNDDIAPTLTLVKTVVNDNGGNNTEGDFTGRIGGNAVPWSVPQTLRADSYIASEDSPLPGYIPSGWGGDCDSQGNVTLAPGDNKVCTIVNDDVAPTITLIKEVINNNGGTAGVNDFGLTVGGNVVTSGHVIPVDANTPIALNEAGLTGYNFVSLTGDRGCPSELGGTATLVEGQNITCTITNDDIAPTLKLVKEVTNDNGGTAVAGNWTLKARRLCPAGSTNPGCGFEDQGDSSIFHPLTAGFVYSLSESGPSGYTMGGWSCDGGTLNGNRLTLGLDEEVTCTITNDDQSGQIKIIKNTVGGNGTFDFNVNGPTTSTPSIPTTGNTGNTGFMSVDAGTYNIAETGQSGWDLTDSSCDSGTPDSFTISNGGSVTCTFTNTQRGSISGQKLEDGTQNPLEGWVIQLWHWVTNAFVNTGITETTDVNGYYSFENLVPGLYQLREVLAGGWTKIFPTGDGIDVTLDPGESDENNNFVNFELGKITVCKYNDVNGNGLKDDGQTELNGVTVQIMHLPGGQPITGITGSGTNSAGCYAFDGLEAGDYEISETVPNGFYQTYPNSPNYFVRTIQSGSDINLYFLNTEYRTISGTKYNDLNGNGSRDAGEPGLEGWTIYLYAGNPSTTTDANGNYQFTNLSADQYTIREVLKNGWTQTEPTIGYYDRDLHFTATSTGNDFGNKQLNPILTITKRNFAGGDKSPGDSVSFEITVTATQSAAYNVEVTDLLPTGFTYRLGSWTGTATEPVYASPGVWQLGDMSKDQTITLTYIADISGTQQAGRYFDLAWAAGCKTDTSCTNDVLAYAINPGFVSDNYVGTEVNIVTNTQNGLSHNVVTTVEGQVLGASTELPATGANTFWLYIAFALITGGISIGALGWFLRRKYE